MGRAGVEDLAAVVAEISLLAGSLALIRASQKVWVRYGTTQRTADKAKKDPVNTTAGDYAKALDKARITKEEFLELARKELGVNPEKEDP